MALYQHSNSSKVFHRFIRILASEQKGTASWLMQRITAIILIPLGVWFIWHVFPYITSNHESMVSFFKSPYEGLLMALFLFTLLYHSQLGFQVIIEDYVQEEFLKLCSIAGLKLLIFILGIWGAFSLVMIQLKTF
jgi:succinate dehydrogenase / fumarate reductase membrane anchor subunit